MYNIIVKNKERQGDKESVCLDLFTVQSNTGPCHQLHCDLFKHCQILHCNLLI